MPLTRLLFMALEASGGTGSRCTLSFAELLSFCVNDIACDWMYAKIPGLWIFEWERISPAPLAQQVTYLHYQDSKGTRFDMQR
jgi:hypothetical protein